MTLFTNVLQIPSLFETLFLSLRQIAFILILPIFAIAVVHENLNQLEDKSNYTGLFVRVLVLVGLLIIYDRFFLMITYGADLLSKTIMPDHEFQNVLKSIFTEVKQKKDFGVFNFLKGALISNITFITYMLTYIAYTVLIWLRFMLLSLIYIVGPILIVFGIYQKTSGALNAWLKSLFQVSCWIVTLSLLVRIASYMNLAAVYNLDQTNTISVITANVLFVLLFVFTPAITASLLSEGSIGTIGSTMIGIATSSAYAVYRQIRPSKALENLKNRQALQDQANSNQ